MTGIYVYTLYIQYIYALYNEHKHCKLYISLVKVEVTWRKIHVFALMRS